MNKLSSFFLIFCILIVLIKDFNRVISNYSKKYHNYPWLKIYSEKKIEYKKINYTGSDFSYYIPMGSLCFYSPGPCSYKKESNLVINKILNFTVISQKY